MQKTLFALVTLMGVAALPAQTQWWVSPTGSDSNPGTSSLPFQTINHANAVASSGDVIRLIAATFGDEQGNVQLGSKSVTLVGAGQGATIVRSHSSIDLMLPAGLLAAPTIEAHRPALTLNGTARVDVRDLTLDCAFQIPGTGRAYSLWVGGGIDTVVTNVECTNARANPINGIQGPLGVNIRGDNAGDVTNVTLRNCLVHEYGKGGVVANYNAFLRMDDCRVDGFGHAYLSLAAQNGIQVSRGATCTLLRTTVTDSWYDPPGTTATGLLLYDAGSPVLVEDCNFGNCQSGIYTFASVPSSIAGTFRRNRVHTAEWGIYFANVSGLTVTDNSFAVSQSGDNDDAWDDATPPNTWSGNYYSSIGVSGSHTLPGYGGAVDATARAGLRGFAAGVATVLPAGCSPLDLVVANLDADTDTDFAALCQSSTPTLVIGNNAGGVFTTSSLAFGNSSGSPVAIVGGEFNGLAGLDLAVVTASVPPSTTENKVYVFANNGAGGFSLLYTHVLAGSTLPGGIAAGNFDGIAADDIAVSDEGAGVLGAGSASVLLNNGTGTGFTTVALTAAYTVACRGVSVADLDGDGNADVAVTEGSSTVGRLHLFRGDGVGGFTTFAGSPLTVDANPHKVLATDLEGDGDRDLLVSCTRDAFGLVPGSVEVLTNSGASTFTASQYLVDRGPTALAAGDFDADADPDTQRRDAVVANLFAGSVTVLGSYGSGAGYGTGGICAQGVTPTAVGIADFNGDGLADLAYADAAAGTVVVLAGRATARVDYYGAGCAGTAGRVPELVALGLPSLPIQPNPTFGIGLVNARSFSPAVVVAGLSPTPVLAPCSLLVLNIGATWVAITDSRGEASFPLPIPAVPNVIGLPLHFQGGVFDPFAFAPFFNGVSLTRGMKLRIGY